MRAYRLFVAPSPSGTFDVRVAQPSQPHASFVREREKEKKRSLLPRVANLRLKPLDLAMSRRDVWAQKTGQIGDVVIPSMGDGAATQCAIADEIPSYSAYKWDNVRFPPSFGALIRGSSAVTDVLPGEAQYNGVLKPKAK
ncbi:hypothetical protein RHS02_08031, partial [Rhizoctonia solani]